MHRDEAIRLIRAALKRRSGKLWSVKGGRGTAWGWIEIDAPPARRTWHYVETGEKAEDGLPVYREVHGPIGGHTGPDDRQELQQLLDLDHEPHFQGLSIAASSDHYQEYVDRAEGRVPSVAGRPYWD